ncbi:helix-turn-helix domain-containing protein [Brevibacterium casei]|uniref:helix-turn-helix domain-containing protein n=1 Tax=Brevibacterium casei TaxID=33889 RepID=UPI0011A88F9D|nr:helix-turn-helix domain-containing protein [Brevibacterium casei]
MTPRPARQTLLRPATPARPLSGPVTFVGHDRHAHDHPLLVHVVSGSVDIAVHRRGGAPPETISVGSGAGLWLRAHVDHAVTVRRESILIGPRVTLDPPGGALEVRTSPEIHELALLILATSPRTEAEKHRFRTALDARLGELIVDAFPIPSSSDPLITAIVTDPLALHLPLADLARAKAVSPRHLERRFRADLGMSYVGWRTRARLNTAMRHLRAGASHRTSARAVGYESADGLIKAAGRCTGLPRTVLAKGLAEAIDAWRVSGAHLQPSGSHCVPSSTR